MTAGRSTSPGFSTRVHGKWIVAGEHAVLRGAPALAFPVYGKFLELKWTDGGAFTSSFFGESGAEFQLLFTGVFDRALEILGRRGDVSLRRGSFEVESSLPVGAGLGASAALSVAVGRWFVSRGAIQEPALFEFCRELENLFHGESSGVDVAVAIESRGLHFQRMGSPQDRMRGFDPAWQPCWYISYSGARGITSECVSKVKQFISENPLRGAAVDGKMAESVRIAERSLRDDSNVNSSGISESRIENLRVAIEMAAECFAEWGLSDGEIGRHMAWLRECGAIAVKPTGSGGGGFALSLWRERPRPEIESQLISVFRAESSRT
jgi:mevalonate kinase